MNQNEDIQKIFEYQFRYWIPIFGSLPIELDKAMVDLYNKKVSEWTGVKKEYIKNTYDKS